MLLKYKNIILLSMVIVVLGLAVAGTTITAFCASASDGISEVVVTGRGVKISAEKYNGTANGEYEVIKVNDENNYYRGAYLFTSEVYLNYSISFTELLNAFQYVTGTCVFQDNLTVSITAPSNWTMDELYYNIAIVSCSSGIDVGMSGGSGSYNFSIDYSDLYANMNSRYYFTILVRCNARCYYSTGSFVQPYMNNLKIEHALSISNFTSALVSDSSGLSEQINDAISDNLSITAIDSHTSQINIKLGELYSQSATQYYGLTTLLSSQYSGLTSQLSTFSNSVHSDFSTIHTDLGTIHTDLQDIYSSLTEDDSGIADDAGDQVNDAHTLEGTAQTGFSVIIEDLFDNTGVSFQNAVDSLDDYSMPSFIIETGSSMTWWQRVIHALFQRSHFAYLASFLMIVLIIGFTAWVLKL